MISIHFSRYSRSLWFISTHLLQLGMHAEEALKRGPDILFRVDLDQADPLFRRKRLLVGLAERREVGRLAPDVVGDLAVTHEVADIDQLAHQIYALGVAPVVSIGEEERVDVP